jgi:hypothetical protein
MFASGACAAASIEYFPKAFYEPSRTCPDSDHKLSIIGSVEARWYPEQWRAASEPSIFAMSTSPGPARVYRFTWLRSFHAPVFVRVQFEADGRATLIAKQLSGAGGYRPGKVVKQLQRSLSEAERDKVSAELARDGVLALPATDCAIGADGAQWIFEASENGTYRFINRWTPRSGPVHDIGLLFLGLTGWSFDPVY